MDNVYKLKDLKIEVTYKCPLFCVHCSSDAFPDSPIEMQYNVCERIVREAIVMGVSDLTISGGEPLVWSGLSSIIELANQNNLNTTVYTSGNSNISEQSDFSIFNELRKKGLQRAIFSLYSSFDTAHELITRKYGSFKRTIHSIKLCNELGISTELHFVVTSENYQELENITALAQELKIDSISLLRFVPQGRGAIFESGIMTREQNLALLSIIKKTKMSGIKVRTGSPYNFLFVNNPPLCLAGIDRLVVSPDLRIYPCDAFKQISAESIAGTVNGSSLIDNSLSECWINSPYLRLLRKVQTSSPIGACASCASYSKCSTGCIAQRFIKNHKLDRSPDPSCIIS